ncbi:MAG TPA: hypothetical protein PKL04_00650 [Methanofastidiosum sp.]|nr:hypothetical protein [Methanofastidiosum sp.]
MTKLEAIRLLLGSNHYEYKPNRYCSSRVYTLAHGEYEQPDYHIRKIRGKDEYEIYMRVYYLPGTFTNQTNHVLTQEELWLLKENANE